MRIALGAVMIGHGSQKVFGGMQNHVHMVSSLGLPGWMAYLSAAADFFCGILVIAGLFTRFAALAILINMSVAIWKVHWKNGLLGQGGYQFPLALGAIAFALIFLGAGPIATCKFRSRSGAIAAMQSRQTALRAEYYCDPSNPTCVFPCC